MPGVSFLGAMSTGHATYPPRPSIPPASPNVNVNGIPVLRQGDMFAIHCNTSFPFDCHGPSSVLIGSTSVKCNGVGIARIGDAIACGDFIAQGSSNVIAGG